MAVLELGPSRGFLRRGRPEGEKPKMLEASRAAGGGKPKVLANRTVGSRRVDAAATPPRAFKIERRQWHRIGRC